jgi:hypothetical protein
MDTTHLPQDFKEFLSFLNEHEVEYLLIGGYAVGYHGYPRATADIDVWVNINRENAQRIVSALEDFGFGGSKLTVDLFLQRDQIVRMGLPPMRIEILTTISGVEFPACYQNRVVDTLDGVETNLISLEDLKTNKRASGRLKDLSDLENLS